MPELRIVSEELWQQVQARLRERANAFPRSPKTHKLMGRPRYQDESAYLLTGFTRCSICGGPVGTELRIHGSNGKFQRVPHYAGLDNRRRGKAICRNGVAVRQDVVDRAILEAITEVLRPEVLTLAVDKALEKLSRRRSQHAGRRAEIASELGIGEKTVKVHRARVMEKMHSGSVPALVRLADAVGIIVTKA